MEGHWSLIPEWNTVFLQDLLGLPNMFYCMMWMSISVTVHDYSPFAIFLTLAGPTKVNVIPTMSKITMLAGRSYPYPNPKFSKDYNVTVCLIDTCACKIITWIAGQLTDMTVPMWIPLFFILLSLFANISVYSSYSSSLYGPTTIHWKTRIVIFLNIIPLYKSTHLRIQPKIEEDSDAKWQSQGILKKLH